MSTEQSRKRTRRGVLAVLHSGAFRALLCSSGLWWFALWMEFLSVGWIALEFTDSAFLVALVAFFRMLPLSSVGLFSGVVIDRFGRRRTILCAQFTQFITAAGMAVLFSSGRAEYWHLLIAAVILGSAWAVDFPARRSLIPDLVGKRATSDAVICEGFAMNAARLLGPVAGGFSLKFFGPPGFYLILTATSLCSLLFLRRLPAGQIPRDGMPRPDSPWMQIRESFRYARSHEVIFAVFLITLTTNLFVFAYTSMLPVIARDVLFLDASGLGIIGMAVGMGALPGIIIIHGLRRKLSEGQIFAFGTMFFSLAIVLFGTSAWFPLSFAALAIAGIGHSCFGLMQTALVLSSATDAMRNRVMGLIVVAIGFSPLGQLLMGALASRYGAPFAIKLCASLGALAIVAVMVFLPKIWRPDKEPG